MARLDAYRSKRKFDKTPEPQGGRGEGEETIFVIQKHRASHLHYDLRLQVGDTLRSWAVPEGPCLDPKVRRFAKEVEDHPLDYASFEGRIPDGQYGAGEVIVSPADLKESNEFAWPRPREISQPLTWLGFERFGGKRPKARQPG